MTRALVWVALVAAVGCGGNAGVPRYRAARPPALAATHAKRPAEAVRIRFKPLPWWTLAGSHRLFILGFDDAPGSPVEGRRVGAIRSRNVALSAAELDAVRCAWKIVPMGDPRPCGALDRANAMAGARDHIESATASLRTQAGRAGADAVVDVRCFGEQLRGGGGVLWCEGAAIAGAAVRSVPDDHAESDPTAPIEREPRLTSTRLVLHADGSAGMLGAVPVLGATLGLRYRPIEVGFYIVDLGREDMDRGLVGLGVTALGRRAIRATRIDLIGGVSALAVASNGSTNPDFDGLYHAFAGAAYQSPWRISGVAQPFVQVRAGVARGTDLASRAAPMVELHFGLSSPERRRR